MRDASHKPGWWQASDGKWYAPELHPDYTSFLLSGDPPAHKTEAPIQAESSPNPSMPPVRSLDQNGEWHLPELTSAGALHHAAAELDMPSTGAAVDGPPTQESELRSPSDSSPRRHRRKVLLGFPAFLFALIALAILLATIGNGTNNHLSHDQASFHGAPPPATAPSATAPSATGPSATGASATGAPTTAPPTTAPPTVVTATTSGNSGNAGNSGTSGNTGNSGPGSTLDPNAQVTFTQCASDPSNPATNAGGAGTGIAISGAVTNTGSTANDYDITIAILGGSSAQGTADAQVSSLGPGQTQSFTTTGSVDNSPTQDLTCQAIEVMSEPV